MNQEKLIININKDLKKQLRIIAIQKDTTMTDIIIPLLEKYVEQNHQ